MKQKEKVIGLTTREKVLRLINTKPSGIAVCEICRQLRLTHKQVLTTLNPEDLVYEDSKDVAGRKVLFLVAMR